MITKIQALQFLHQQLGLSVSKEELRDAFSRVDQQAFFEQARARFKIELWDKKSPINGIPAEQLLTQEGFSSEGEVYLIYCDNHLIILQPFDPTEAGFVPMTRETALARASEHVDRLAWQIADEKILQALVDLLI